MKSGPILVAAVLLAGCYGDQADLQARIGQVKQEPGEPIEPLPSIESPETFEYAAFDLRDPFEGSIDAPVPDEVAAAPEGTGPQPDFNRRREVLEGFELDSLEMVGTFDIEATLFGLVRDPEGLLHRVRPGDYMGRNHGQILAVYDDRIELLELVPDGVGWREQEAALALDEEL